MDFPFKYKLRGTRQKHVRETSILLGKTDLELIAPLYLDLHRRAEFVDSRRDQGRCGYTGTASQRFPFNSPFKGADANTIRAEQLHEIHVCALWPEVRVAADF